MHFSVKELVGIFAQEWYVICAYFGMYVLLEIRKHGEKIAVHRVVRHALWAASFVIVLHAAVVVESLTRRSGFNFGLFDYEIVTCLTGCTMFLLGEMFEEVPKLADAGTERQP